MFEETLWISHSALSSFERCPHLYYLEYIYKNPKTNNRIQITNPYFSLGLAVHQAIEEMAKFSIKERKSISLLERYNQIFENYQGLKGGFISKKKEDDFYNRGVKMIEKIEKSLLLSTNNTSTKTDFPKIDLFSRKELGIKAVLVGSIDWIELNEKNKAHIIDFKTGNSKESNGSMQLSIYKILAQKNLQEEVEKVSYWYLQHDNSPVEQTPGDTKECLHIIKEKTKEIKKAIDENNFKCNFSGKCFSCRDYEKIFSGEAEQVQLKNSKNKDVFCVFKEKDIKEKIMEEDFLDEREKKIFEMRLETNSDNIKKELRLSDEKFDKISEEVRHKLKDNLRSKELKVVVKMLQK